MEQVPLRKRVEYAKLVRDKIPEIIRKQGETCEVSVLSKDEYAQALREKLIEEAKEAAEASKEHLITELADVYEVMAALMHYYGLAPETIRTEQLRRRAERGGFDKRLKLLWVE